MEDKVKVVDSFPFNDEEEKTDKFLAPVTFLELRSTLTSTGVSTSVDNLSNIARDVALQTVAMMLRFDSNLEKFVREIHGRLVETKGEVIDDYNGKSYPVGTNIAISRYETIAVDGVKINKLVSKRLDGPRDRISAENDPFVSLATGCSGQYLYINKDDNKVHQSLQCPEILYNNTAGMKTPNTWTVESGTALMRSATISLDDLGNLFVKRLQKQ
jgi:hypothetical protein